jgi:amidase
MDYRPGEGNTLVLPGSRDQNGRLPQKATLADLCFLTAADLAQRIRRKELSAREVLDAHLRQIERVNPQVNAIVTLVAEAAQDRARLLDEDAARGNFHGPLHGLPIAHKDLIETKGIRTTLGSPIFKDYIPTANSLIVDRLQAAGAVSIGKTNTPEFGAGAQTFNAVFGATRNPWDLTKTCGGSSGGAAVSLACGMTPIADGTDMGGSLRIPASFCSVVGLRPSPGRVPRVPCATLGSNLSVFGPLARTVEDAALLMSVMAGPDHRDPLSIEEPGSLFAQPLGRDCKGLRVGWCAAFAGLPFERRVTEVFEAQRSKFEALGCITSDAHPDLAGAEEAFLILRALNFYQQLAGLLSKHRHLIKPAVVAEIERGARLTGPEIACAESLRSQLYASIGRLMIRYDFLVLPVAQAAPFNVDQEYVAEIDGVQMENYIAWFRSCYFITMTGLPAISVPAGFTAEGLPVGVQIVGRHQADWTVLQLAHAFEAVNSLKGGFPALAKETKIAADSAR